MLTCLRCTFPGLLMCNRIWKELVVVPLWKERELVALVMVIVEVRDSSYRMEFDIVHFLVFLSYYVNVVIYLGPFVEFIMAMFLV